MGYLMGDHMSPPPQLLRSRRPAIVAEAQPLRRAVTSQETKLPPIKQQHVPIKLPRGHLPQVLLQLW